MGYSRDSFCKFKELYNEGDKLTLHELSKRKPIIKNRVEQYIEKAFVDLGSDHRSTCISSITCF